MNKQKIVNRYVTQCGLVIEGVLTDFEKKYYLTKCPNPCSHCGKPHGYEPFNIMDKDIVVR